MTPDETSTNAREEIIKELLLRKQQRKKDWNKNIFSVRTNDNLAVKIKNHCKENNISFNSFFNTLLTKFFN
tara:strand:- start:1067 stop:1279 length:213 start_codon:yes stop_codon:yes gene_type:complete